MWASASAGRSPRQPSRGPGHRPDNRSNLALRSSRGAKPDGLTGYQPDKRSNLAGVRANRRMFDRLSGPRAERGSTPACRGVIVGRCGGRMAVEHELTLLRHRTSGRLDTIPR
jgi:hypothetical protein